ncbi:hypothetical protein C8R46DRAFT_1352701 [Mycena filopes]|nr:hypothetical protein C8R46DRAFT_1352701 [Mycena filopes]
MVRLWTQSLIILKCRSVFQLMHGLGETFRGTVLRAIDDLENRGEQKHHDVARQGRAEIDDVTRRIGCSGARAAPILTRLRTKPVHRRQGTMRRLRHVSPRMRGAALVDSDRIRRTSAAHSPYLLSTSTDTFAFSRPSTGFLLQQVHAYDPPNSGSCAPELPAV